MTALAHIALVSTLTVALETARLGWHGRWRLSPSLIAVHAACAVLLAAYALPLWLAAVAVLVAGIAHLATLDAKRMGRWYGQLLSGAAALPWEVAAAAAVTWPLWGTAAFWWTVAWWIGLGAAIKWGLWRSRLRPEWW